MVGRAAASFRLAQVPLLDRIDRWPKIVLLDKNLRIHWHVIELVPKRPRVLLQHRRRIIVQDLLVLAMVKGLIAALGVFATVPVSLPVVGIFFHLVDGVVKHLDVVLGRIEAFFELECGLGRKHFSFLPPLGQFLVILLEIQVLVPLFEDALHKLFAFCLGMYAVLLQVIVQINLPFDFGPEQRESLGVLLHF